MRPAVLIVDPDDVRRHSLSRGLAELGYESVPAVSPEEGLRFARGLEPGVIVASAELAGFGDAAVLETFSFSGQRTLVLVGTGEGKAQDLPDDVRYVDASGLSQKELLGRVYLVLVGREVGVEADFELRSLVGELSLQPLLEVVRRLHRGAVTGRLLLEAGDIVFDGGEVVAARAGPCRGLKAFLRLSRDVEGPFHIELGPVRREREIDLGVSELVLKAVEESQIELPDPRVRLQVVDGGGLTDLASSDLGILLDAIESAETVADLLDRVPASDGRIAQALTVLTKRGAVRLEKPRAAVTVVTDSTCDLPEELVRTHDIRVAPLAVRFGRSSFRDGVDLKPRDFYKLLAAGGDHPTTEPPSEPELSELFRGLIEEQDVLAVHISGKLSKTVENARRAALGGIREFDRLPHGRRDFALEVVDSETVSIGTGMLALFASRMAHRGLTVFEITHRLRDLIPRLGLLFVVDTFDYLVRGGRIGRARALVGKLLGIRPILGVVDGEVAAVDRVRMRQAYPRMVELVGRGIDAREPIVAAVAHAQAPASADRLRALLEKRFEVREMIATDIGPTVGTHAGPGCAGCAVIQPTAEEWPLVAPLDS